MILILARVESHNSSWVLGGQVTIEVLIPEFTCFEDRTEVCCSVFTPLTKNVMLNKTHTISEVLYIDVESWSCITYFIESKEVMSIITPLKLLLGLLIMVMLCGSCQIQVPI